MSGIKKALIFTIFISLTLFLIRAWVYSQIVGYESIGKRNFYTVNDPRLASFLNSKGKEIQDDQIKDVIKQALQITSKHLKYTAAHNHNDPNLLLDSRTAHCVGYATFFATTCQYLLDVKGLDANWKIEHHVGQLYILGMNIHHFFDSPFFRDHDFVVIQHRETGEKYAVDPTIHDFLAIKFISCKD